MRILALAFVALTNSSCIVVVAATCTDGITNGDESDVDCGGLTCAPCNDGRFCVHGSDCVTNVCMAGRCGGQVIAPSCTDGVQNGNETGIDCGGNCAPCVNHPTGAGAPFPASNTTTYQIRPNVGVSVAAGVQTGYGITVGTGDAFQLYFTGFGQQMGMFQEFWGSIYTPGSFSNVVPGCSGGTCAIETGDFISQPYAVSGGQRIDFDTFAPDNLDGLEFTVNVEPVYFDLYIDGQHRPMQVFFQSTATGAIANVGVIPFGLGIN